MEGSWSCHSGGWKVIVLEITCLKCISIYLLSLPSATYFLTTAPKSMQKELALRQAQCSLRGARKFVWMRNERSHPYQPVWFPPHRAFYAPLLPPTRPPKATNHTTAHSTKRPIFFEGEGFRVLWPSMGFSAFL